ncbi:MAG: hypothetical protein AAF799_45180 [Myxococcota bacterium]
MDERTREELAAIDRQLEEVRIPPELEQRILHPSARELSRGPMVLVGMALAVLVGLAWWVGRSTRPSPTIDDSASVAEAEPTVPAQPELAPAPTPAPVPAPPSPQLRWSGALALAPGCETTGTTDLEVRAGCRLTLADPRMEIDVLDASKVRPAERGVLVERGLVLVSVDPIESGKAPVRVEVTGGTIEVTGTRFLIVQNPDTRYVHLLEGSISFIPTEGPATEAVLGVPLHWGHDAPSSGPASPKRPSSAATTSPPPLDGVLDEIAALRRRQHYREAVNVLRRARSRVDDPAVQEVLSFEEGTLREHYRPAASVCSYWRGHLTRFFAGRDATPIVRRLERLDCPLPDPSNPP